MRRIYKVVMFTEKSSMRQDVCVEGFVDEAILKAKNYWIDEYNEVMKEQRSVESILTQEVTLLAEGI